MEKLHVEDGKATNSDAPGWFKNYCLYGRTNSTANAIQLNNYGSGDGGGWKSYMRENRIR